MTGEVDEWPSRLGTFVSVDRGTSDVDVAILVLTSREEELGTKKEVASQLKINWYTISAVSETCLTDSICEVSPCLIQ